MSGASKRGGARAGAGRKSNAELGLGAVRDERVVAYFTAAQRAQLEREADDEGVTVGELVAARALAIVSVPRGRP